MSYELIVSEKPQAAQKIAAALSDSAPKKKRTHNVNYFEITHQGKPIVVASAVGHLYGLGEKGGESWEYPVFETEWKPTYKISKASDYTKDYIKVLEELGAGADEVTIASDFDIEGEVIGLNVVLYALKRSDANRMKFSTLTKNDLVKAYANKQPHLEWGQAKAGDTRHHLDWFYGINLSRAFTTSIKKGANQFKVLSTGRVQGPALHFLAERERKIQAFVPETYWEIYLDGICENTPIIAQFELDMQKAKEEADLRMVAKKELQGVRDEEEDEEDKLKVERYKIFAEEYKDTVLEETQHKNGTIKDITSRTFKQATPTPFDLTSLQMEASNHLGYSPKRTLEIAQKLYIEGITSYPRTSSQKLPQELNLKTILGKLEKQPIYKDKVAIVRKVNPNIKPKEGKKTDPAHPAIHPTGEVPSKLLDQERKIYDLIVKRFFAVFGEDAVRETNTITIDINSHNFILKGTRTIEKNWHELYEPYLKFEDIQLPPLHKGESVENKEIRENKKETSPPKRYTDASIIKELEKRNLGTKATRADILNNLKERGYIIDKSIKVTELGLKMDEVLANEVPTLVDEELTRKFEEEMEEIREEKKTPEKILALAKDELLKILEDIKSREVEFGEKLADAAKLARAHLARVAPCPSCEKGTLVLKTSKKTKGKFIACDQYPECKTIFKSPPGIVRGLEEDAVDENGKIWVLAGKTEGSLRKLCINPDTPKEEEEKLGHKKYEEEGMTCPTCGEGEMVLRKSFYGEFLGCNNYPKCKTMMKITKEGVDTTPIVAQAKKKKTTTKKTTKKPTAKKTIDKKKKEEK